MARYVIITARAASPVTYLYEDARKALSKVRTLQRLMTDFELRDGATNLVISVDELEKRER